MDNGRGLLLPDEKALLYLRKQFVLSAKAQGRLGQFYQVASVKYKGVDQEYDYKDPVEVAYHLDVTPSRKLLTKYGWVPEEDQLVPIILYLTYFDINNKPITIDEGCLLEIKAKHSITANDIQTELFKITDLHTDLELNQCICKVTPVREEQKENVSVLATEKDPTLENVYLNRKIYYDDGGVTK